MSQTHLNTVYLSKLCFIVALGGFLFGFDTAVISGTISLVTDQFSLDAVTSGLYVSCALAGCMLGVVTAGLLSDRFGRKKMLIISGVLFLLSALGCMVASNFDWLIISRFIGGIAVGFASILSPMYISEISPAHMRGRLVSLYQLAITIGILTAYFSNSFLLNLHETIILPQSIIFTDPWRMMLGAELVPALCFIVLLFFVPRSPRWLIQQNFRSEAQKVLQKIANKTDVDYQISEIEASLKHETGGFKELVSLKVRRALFVGIILSLFVQFSGINAIIFYGPDIFERAGFTLSDALGGQVSIGVVNVLFTLLAIYKIDDWGRKKLLLIGSIGVITSLLVIALLFWLELDQAWLLISFLLIFIASFACALGPVNWVILSEIFPNKVRSKAMAVASLSVWFGTMLVGQFFPIMIEKFGSSGTFLAFAIISMPLLIIIMKLLPETKDKTLEEIERLWDNNTNIRTNKDVSLASDV